jgi:hypothetical protein
MNLKLNQSAAEVCSSQYGLGEGSAVWKYDRFNLTRLEEDAKRAVAGWSWEKGSFGHSLPLTRSLLTSFGQDHYNNHFDPALNERLDGCPYFRAIFDSFDCQKSSYRLLWRPPLTGYTWHADWDLGENTFRVQIPIQTNSEAYLVVSNSQHIEDFEFPDQRFVLAKNWSQEGIQKQTMRDWFGRFIAANLRRIRVYNLAPGYLYHFDTTQFHSVYNFGNAGRLALTLDLVANPWLEQRFPEMSFRRTHRLQAAGQRMLPSMQKPIARGLDEPGRDL